MREVLNIDELSKQEIVDYYDNEVAVLEAGMVELYELVADMRQVIELSLGDDEVEGCHLRLVRD